MLQKKKKKPNKQKKNGGWRNSFGASPDESKGHMGFPSLSEGLVFGKSLSLVAK